MSANSTQTTDSERRVRIVALAANADREDLQVLLELGARRAQELDGRATDADLDPGALRFAADIAATFNPEVPAFERGARVSYADCTRPTPVYSGRSRIAT